MRRRRCFLGTAGVCALAAAALPIRAQQTSPQLAAVQQATPQSVQESEQQAVQQAVRQAEQASARQSTIGTISLEDATVTGAASTSNDRATLAGNGTVVAKDHVAYVELARGGAVRVCATSGLHLTAGVLDAAVSPATIAPDPVTTPNPVLADPTGLRPPAPLMLSLDRGALEVRMNATASDLLMTPDLRIGFSEAGALDLRVRVTRNGDTCVENRVAGLNDHPTLRVASLFGDETYNVLPGQHVLFERGSLREVVDNESSPCGCPEAPAIPPAVEAGDLSLQPGTKVSSTQAEAQHPFPAAVSQGLAPQPEAPLAPSGGAPTQDAAALTYSGTEAAEAAKKDQAAKKEAVASAADTAPVPTRAVAKKRGFFRDVGRFFKRIFQSAPEP